MEMVKMKCPYCDVGLKFKDGQQGRSTDCPKCGMKITFVGQAAAPQPAPVAAGSAFQPQTPTPQPLPFNDPPPAAPAGASAGDGTNYPERMKANRALAGRECPACHAAIELGEDVFNCPKCQSTMHMNCRQSYGSCARCNPAVKPAAAAIPIPMAAVVGSGIPGPAGQLTAPCRFCHEQIVQGASKCRFCGEYQHESTRRLHQMQARNTGDDSLHWAEILLGILCSGIGCIVGIIYAIQGKKKGGKLILLSIIAGVFWAIIRALIESSQSRY